MEKKVVRQVVAATSSTTPVAPNPPEAPKKPTVEELLAGTESIKIWNEIKDRPIDVFSLPNQVVSDYFHLAFVEPSKLYLTMTRASAAIPALEVSVGKSFMVELVNKYVVVSRVMDI